MKRPSQFLGISASKRVAFSPAPILVVVFSFFLSSLLAVPIGNPSLPALLQEGFFVPDTSWSNPQLGVSSDYLIQKRMSSCGENHSLGFHRASLWGHSQVGIATWSIREKFNLQVELGSGQFAWQWQQSEGTLAGQSKGGLIWSGDAKLVIFEARDTSLAFDVHAGGGDWTDGPAALNRVARVSKSRADFRYWQVGLAFTQKIFPFSPYLGIAVNRFRFNISDLSTGEAHMESRHVVGPFGGCSIGNGSRVLVNLEW